VFQFRSITVSIRHIRPGSQVFGLVKAAASSDVQVFAVAVCAERRQWSFACDVSDTLPDSSIQHFNPEAVIRSVVGSSPTSGAHYFNQLQEAFLTGNLENAFTVGTFVGTPNRIDPELRI
jgi:hypothetical protein